MEPATIQNLWRIDTMAKNDKAHSVRLVDSLDRIAGHDTANEFEKKYLFDNKITLIQ